MKNLLYAMDSLESEPIEPILFVQQNIDANLREELSCLARVVEALFLSRRSVKRFFFGKL